MRTVQAKCLQNNLCKTSTSREYESSSLMSAHCGDHQAKDLENSCEVHITSKNISVESTVGYSKPKTWNVPVKETFNPRVCKQTHEIYIHVYICTCHFSFYSIIKNIGNFQGLGNRLTFPQDFPAQMLSNGMLETRFKSISCHKYVFDMTRTSSPNLKKLPSSYTCIYQCISQHTCTYMGLSLLFLLYINEHRKFSGTWQLPYLPLRFLSLKTHQ